MKTGRSSGVQEISDEVMALIRELHGYPDDEELLARAFLFEKQLGVDGWARLWDRHHSDRRFGWILDQPEFPLIVERLVNDPRFIRRWPWPDRDLALPALADAVGCRDW